MTTFNEVKSALEQTIADPLLTLRAKIATINQYHNQCLQQCQGAINALVNGSDGQPPWQGPGGKAVADTVANYLSAARAISGTDTDLYGTMLDGYMLKPIQIGEKIANELYNSLESITGPRQIAATGLAIPSGGTLPVPRSGPVSSVDPAGGIVAGIDAGAVAQGGLDIPWDIVAGIATGGYLIYKAVTHNPDQDHIDMANQYAKEAEQMYEQQIDEYEGSETMQQLPNSPKGPDGGFTTFLLVIGLLVLAGGVIVLAGGPTLSQTQEQDLETLTKEFPNVSSDDIKGLLQAGFTVDEIRAILKAGFTHDQIQAIIRRIKTAQKDQHGTDTLGLTTVQIRDLVNRVAVAVNSPDEDIQREGEVGRALIDDLVAFQHEIINPATGETIGEVDVETSNTIIEVTNEENGKLDQVLKEKNNKQMNPKGKQVILYAPRYSHAADGQFKSNGVPIIRSFKDLFDYLRSL